MLNKVLISLAWFILMLIQIFWPLNHAYQSISVIKLPAVTQNHFIYDSITRPKKIQDTIVPAISTFLGNEQKNYYGNSASSKLDVIWRKYLGSGKTYIPNSRRASIWFGAGWTGQPLLIKERKRKYLIQGAYDHKLKKIDALTGEIIWEYSFDDVIKGTGTFWINSKAENAEDKYIILQGSSRGIKNYIKSNFAPSYRAVSYLTGKELWRLNVKKTECYSMDVDGSALVVNDTAYIGLENGLFVALDPDKKKFDSINSTSSPDIINQLYLYTEQDKILHGKDLVTESSPCLLGNHIYITCGSGHVYGYNLTKKEIDWDLYLAADLNGSPVVTSDSCLLVTIEKQYIPGSGGVIKLNPALPPDKSIVWFFPTLDKRFGQWHGGIIGSVAVNDKYKCDSSISLCGFSAIDGYLYIINHKSLEPKKLVTGPNNKKQFPTPKLLYKYYIGASISTPIIVNNRIIAAGYGGIYIFEFNNQMKFTLLDRKPGIFESTPIADDNKIFIASRDGYLYCFGDKNDTGSSAQSDIKILADLKAITSISDSKPKEITINASNIETSSDKVLEKHPKEEKTVTKPSGVIPVQGKADKTQKYKIVAGSFKTAAQAETFNAILISRGFDSEIMGPKNKFYYNIINSFPTLNEAYQEIIRIREGGTSQVWVLEY